MLTLPTSVDITYGDRLTSTQLDATASVPGSFLYTPALDTVLSAGAGQTLSVTFTPTDTADYNDATASVLINVQQAAPTFSGLTESQTITYGKATIDVAGTLSSATAIPVGQDVTVTINGAATTAEVGADGSFAATIDTATLPASATPYPIAYGYAGDANFQSASDSTTTLMVNAAPLTVTATGESMTYGGTVPALTYTYTGLVNGDTASVFSGALATTGTAASGVGSYPISQGTLVAGSNYSISFTDWR